MLVAYVAAVVAGGFATLWATGFGNPPPEALPFLFWLLANLLGEVLWLPAPRGRGYLSMATAANFAAIIVLPASFAIAVTALAQALADVLFRRRRWYQVLFNFGMCSVTVFVASMTFTGLGGAHDGVEALLSPLNAGPLAAAAIAYFAVNTSLVAGAIALHKRHNFASVWRTSFGFGYQIFGIATLTLLGYFFAVLFFTWGYLSAFLAAAATYFVRDAYVRYVREQDRRMERPAIP
jgi:magnesium-transporting ATPase (P-type)